jgi:hypothetical protein
MPNPERARAFRAHGRAVRRSAKKKAAMAPVLNAQMSRTQNIVARMRHKGTLGELTGDGGIDEQDLEAEWQHKLETSPNWQEKMEKMTNNQKKNFLRHRRDAFLEGLRKAFAHAQAKLDAGRLTPADDGGEHFFPSREARFEKEGSEVTDALSRFQQDRLQELDGFQPELLQEVLRIPTTSPKQGLSPKEYEALTLAKIQRDRKHQDNPDALEATSDQQLLAEEAQALDRITEEREHQSEVSKEKLMYKESQRLKKAARKITLKAFDARRKKFDAKQAEFKTKKQARKDSQKAAKEQSAKALEIKKQAKADGPSQEELAQIRREAKKDRKKRKRAAFLEADPHTRKERAQIEFGFRYFPTKKARVGAQKQLSGNEVS